MKTLSTNAPPRSHSLAIISNRRDDPNDPTQIIIMMLAKQSTPIESVGGCRGRLMMDTSDHTHMAVSLFWYRFFHGALLSASMVIHLRSTMSTPIRDVRRQ